MKKWLKGTLIGIGSLLGIIILTVGSYALYVVFQYNRIEDNLPLEIKNNQENELVTINEAYDISTYNIGFGAYSPSFSFFMDSGTYLNGEEVSGIYGKAYNKDEVLKNTNGAIETLLELDTDFTLIQEMDTDSDRSHHINQYQMFLDGFTNQSSTFAINYHSAYLFYPFNDPIGKSNSGIATFSKYTIDESIRRAYPLSTGFDKFFDLDRCFSINYFNVTNNKKLVIINSHMSAYDEGGYIREAQLKMLNEVITDEYNKGNYVIVGGDFNNELADSIGKFPSEEKTPTWVKNLTEDDFPEHFNIVATMYDENGELTATCRAAEIPYTKGVNYLNVIDGFIVSDNIKVNSVYNINNEFSFSDHQPVKMEFELI